MSGQLTFSLPPRAQFARADFFASPANAAALDAVAAGGLPRLLLIGPHGSGKTHLAHIAASLGPAHMVSLAALEGHLPDVTAQSRIVIDDIDHADASAQAALFHLFNLLTPQGHLLFTATKPPRDWDDPLPDLVSRLQTLPMARLNPPDDALLSAVLVKLFADHQITVPPNLIAYLVPRMERSIAAARTLVAALDARALALSRPVTRALAAEVLDKGPAR